MEKLRRVRWWASGERASMRRGSFLGWKPERFGLVPLGHGGAQLVRSRAKDFGERAGPEGAPELTRWASGSYPRSAPARGSYPSI